MRTPQRVVWTEGMFMSPQHLQQQDVYHEEFVAARVGAVSAYAWGVAVMDIDAEALAAGQLQLLRFSGVLPDGVPLAFERGQVDAPPARPVEPHVQSNQAPVEVYLGIPKDREGVDSYRQLHSASSETTRFEVANRTVPDQMSSSSVVPVGFAKASVRLLFGTEPREDFECIKIAELVRDGTGALAISESYIAPCLRVSAAPAILNGARKLLRQMLGKQRELSGARRHRDAASLEFTASDVTRYLQLNTLNSAIPLLNHVVDTADLSPLEAYLLMLQITGPLFTFSPEGDPSTLPKFQYLHLNKTFEPLFERASMLLRGLALEQCVAVLLEQRQGGLQVGRLDDERFRRCSQFILTVKSVLPEKQVADQFPKLSKIASTNEIHGLVQSATPGVPLQVTFRPPPEVPVRPGVVYFSLSTQDPYWKNVVRDKSVAIYLPQSLDPSRTQLELLGVPQGGASQ